LRDLTQEEIVSIMRLEADFSSRSDLSIWKDILVLFHTAPVSLPRNVS
jgi:hypothetical protein